MPLFTFYTNVARSIVSQGVLSRITKHLVQSIGKSEEKMIVTIVPEQLVLAAGTTEPCGSGSLVSIGSFDRERQEKVISGLSVIMHEDLGIPKQRQTFIERLSREKVEMPIFTLYTNISNDKIGQDFLLKVSKILSNILEKPEDRIFVNIMGNQRLINSGSNNPCAHASLQSVGHDKEKNEKIVNELSALLEQTLGVPKSRFLIIFSAPELHNIGKGGTLLA